MDTASTVDRVGATMETFLPPIEQPLGLFMKLAYYFTRRQFGSVLTPLKVHSARLSPAFGLFYTKIGKLDKKLPLPLETVLRRRARPRCGREGAWRADGDSLGGALCLVRRHGGQPREYAVAHLAQLARTDIVV